MLFGVSFHPGSFHPADLHPVENDHPSGSKSSGLDIEKSGSPVVASGHDPFSPSSSGLPSGSSLMKSTLRDIKLPHEVGNYAVENTPDEHGIYPLYMRDPETDAPKYTGNYVKRDGHGGWERVGGERGGKLAGPSLPPAAEIDPSQLGPLNEDGVYPGKDGNSYARRDDVYHRVIRDKQLDRKQSDGTVEKGWKMVDPEKPHDPDKSVVVKLDKKGGAEPLSKPELKGGNDRRAELTEKIKEVAAHEATYLEQYHSTRKLLDELTERMNSTPYASAADVQQHGTLATQVKALEKRHTDAFVERQVLEEELRNLPASMETD
jgi:hypothetical protein